MPYLESDTSWSQQELRTEAYLTWLKTAEARITEVRREAVRAQIVLIQEKAKAKREKTPGKFSVASLTAKLDLL